MEDLSDLAYIIILIALFVFSAISKTIKSVKEARQQMNKSRQAQAQQTLADSQQETTPKQHNAAKVSTRRQINPDVVMMDEEEGSRVIADLSYDDLRKVMSDADIAKRFPVEYERHQLDLKLQEHARLQKALEIQMGEKDIRPSLTKDRPHLASNLHPHKTALHHNTATSSPMVANATTTTPTQIPDLSTPNAARAAFIAAELFNRKY